MVKKKYFIVLVLVSTLLSGCFRNNDGDPLLELSKGELVEIINEQSTDLNMAYDRLEQAELLLSGITEGDGTKSAISTMQDGTGRLTFNSIAGKIIFPTPFEYPGSTQAANTSSINITSTLSIVPTSNWIAVLSGTSLELQHISGISGIIRAGHIDRVYDRNLLQTEVMSNFFAGFPPERIQYSRLFLNDNWWGLDARSPTRIDGEPAFIRAGMLGLGNQSFTYIFLYRGENDASKDDAILSLLRTIKMNNQSLRIE